MQRLPTNLVANPLFVNKGEKNLVLRASYAKERGASFCLLGQYMAAGSVSALFEKGNRSRPFCFHRARDAPGGAEDKAAVHITGVWFSPWL